MSEMVERVRCLIHEGIPGDQSDEAFARAIIGAMRLPPFPAIKIASEKIGVAMSLVDLCWTTMIDEALK